jgi:hypothetical protein
MVAAADRRGRQRPRRVPTAHCDVRWPGPPLTLWIVRAATDQDVERRFADAQATAPLVCTSGRRNARPVRPPPSLRAGVAD